MRSHRPRTRLILPAALAACVAVGVSAWPSRAEAQGVDRTAEARRHFETAMAALGDGRYQQAVEELRAARDLGPTASVHYNLGLACRAIGRNVEAMAAFEAFLLASAEGASPDAARVQAARRFIRELREGAARWSVETEPPGATLRLDGAAVVSPGGEHLADPGDHVLEVSAEGREPVTRSLRLGAGLHERLRVTLPRRDDSGRVRITVVPSNATIRLDLEALGQGQVDEPVSAGRHVIDVTAAGYASFHREVDVPRGQTLAVRAELSDARGIASRPWFWVVIGVAVAGAAVGAVVLLSSTEEPPATTLGHVHGALVAW